MQFVAVQAVNQSLLDAVCCCTRCEPNAFSSHNSSVWLCTSCSLNEQLQGLSVFSVRFAAVRSVTTLCSLTCSAQLHFELKRSISFFVPSVSCNITSQKSECPIYTAAEVCSHGAPLQLRGSYSSRQVQTVPEMNVSFTLLMWSAATAGHYVLLIGLSAVHFYINNYSTIIIIITIIDTYTVHEVG
jgi:hypothetical protein